MSGIAVRDLCKSFGEKRVFSGLDFDMPERRITVLLGPSGCGKTTILNILSGTIPLDSGTVTGTEGKRISYLFQEPRLLPWKTVRGNIEFVLGDTEFQEAHEDEMAGMGAELAPDEPYSIGLEPGASKSLIWTFTEPMTLEYGCHVPGHYAQGMVGTIEVTEP